MQYTERDYKILEFLNIAPSTTVIVADYLGASKQVIQRRLQKLYEIGAVKRHRQDINSCYVYWIDGKQPKDLGHMLMLSKLYVYLVKKGYQVPLFRREVILAKGIRADGITVIDRGNGLEPFIIEVDIWTRPQDKVKKYEGYKHERLYREVFGDVCPKMLWITNKQVKSKELDIETMRLDFYDK